MTDRCLRDVRLKFSLNVKLATGVRTMPAIVEIGDISARDVKPVRAYNYVLTRKPGTEDFTIVDAYSRIQGLSQILPFLYQGNSSPSYLDVYTVEPRSAVYYRILNLLLFIFAAISAYGVFTR